MTSRRAFKHYEERVSRALQFIPGHVGGRVASAQPVNRRGGTLRQPAVGAAGGPSTANPWPLLATWPVAVAATSTSRTWTYDPHPQTILRIRCSIRHTGTPGTFHVVADGVTSTTGTIPASPGGGSFLLYLTPSVPGLVTVVLNWSPAAAMNLALESEMGIQPEWT